MIRVFLDANVLFSAFDSPKGPSGLILEFGRRGKILILANRIVLKEADRNLRLKASQKAVTAFHRFLNQAEIEIVPPVSEERLAHYAPFIHPKDVPILAAAVEAKADFLLTLDQRDFFKPAVLSHSGQTKIEIPVNFIHEYVRKGRL